MVSALCEEKYVVEKAMTIAEHLGHTDLRHRTAACIAGFMRNNTKQRKICGESGDVRSDTDESWKERLPQIDYKPEDIQNVDETGCLLRALPDKGLRQMCKGCKKSKHKGTIAFFLSMVRENLNLFLL